MKNTKEWKILGITVWSVCFVMAVLIWVRDDSVEGLRQETINNVEKATEQYQDKIGMIVAKQEEGNEVIIEEVVFSIKNKENNKRNSIRVILDGCNLETQSKVKAAEYKPSEKFYIPATIVVIGIVITAVKFVFHVTKKERDINFNINQKD